MGNILVINVSCIYSTLHLVADQAKNTWSDICFNMFLKGYPLEAKNASKNWNQSVRIFNIWSAPLDEGTTHFTCWALY